MRIKVGDKVAKGLSEEPWLVKDEDGDKLFLVRGKPIATGWLEEKWLKRASVQATYLIVGSPAFHKSLEGWRRNGWKIWQGYLEEGGASNVEG